AWILIHSAVAKISRASSVARSNAVGARNFNYEYRVSWQPYAGGHVQVFELKKIQVVTPALAPVHAVGATSNVDAAPGIAALLDRKHSIVAQIGQVDVYVNDASGHTAHLAARVSPDLIKVLQARAAAAQADAATQTSTYDVQTVTSAARAYAKASQGYTNA